MKTRLFTAKLMYYFSIRYKVIMLSFLTSFFAILYANAQDSYGVIDTTAKIISLKERNEATRITNQFVIFMFQEGKVDSLLSICEIPIVVDGKVVETREQLQEIFRLVVSGLKTSTVKSKIDTTYIHGARNEVLDDLVPIKICFVVNVVKLIVGDQTAFKQAVFAIRLSEIPKIVGISAE